MPKLWELAKLVRAKNAGPFTLTVDIVFGDAVTCDHVKRSGVITRELIAHMYRVPVDDVLFIERDRALAAQSDVPKSGTMGTVMSAAAYRASW